MKKREFTNKWIKQRIGALPSPFDPRNLKYMKLPTAEDAYETPEEFDGLMDFSPDNFGRNQGSVGTCVGWDWNYCWETEYELLSLSNETELARLMRRDVVSYVRKDFSSGWAYQFSRRHSSPPVPDNVEGSTNFGAVRAAKRIGIVTEATVPTDITAPFNFIEETDDMLGEAALHRVSSYHNIPNDPESIKAAIYGLLHEMSYKMSNGDPGQAPVMSAFPVHANYKDGYDDGIVPMPEGRLLGGHSVPMFGWKLIDDKPHWINFGSWGTDIGDNGVFYMPFDYPFYPNDWWLLKIAATVEPPKPTCIYDTPGTWTEFLNIFASGGDKYYHGVEVE